VHFGGPCISAGNRVAETFFLIRCTRRLPRGRRWFAKFDLLLRLPHWASLELAANQPTVKRVGLPQVGAMKTHVEGRMHGSNFQRPCNGSPSTVVRAVPRGPGWEKSRP
jgi:hypothetical protein